MKYQHPLQQSKSHVPQEYPLHRMVRDFWGPNLDFYTGTSHQQPTGSSNVQLSEDETHVFVEANLPGLTGSEIDVTLDKGILWIQGEKQDVEDKKRYHYRASRSYSYQLALPESVNESRETSADYKNGILHITFNKNEWKSAKKININKSCCV